jgi:hypothetical protein
LVGRKTQVAVGHQINVLGFESWGFHRQFLPGNRGGMFTPRFYAN